MSSFIKQPYLPRFITGIFFVTVAPHNSSLANGYLVSLLYMEKDTSSMSVAVFVEFIIKL